MESSSYWNDEWVGGGDEESSMQPSPLLKLQHSWSRTPQDVSRMIENGLKKVRREVTDSLRFFLNQMDVNLNESVEEHPEWQEPLTFLKHVAEACVRVSADQFWVQCDEIMDEVDKRRRVLPQGMVREHHMRMMFLLARCTRLWRFRKESGVADDNHLGRLSEQPTILESVRKGISVLNDEDKMIPVAVKSSREEMEIEIEIASS